MDDRYCFVPRVEIVNGKVVLHSTKQSQSTPDNTTTSIDGKQTEQKAEPSTKKRRRNISAAATATPNVAPGTPKVPPQRKH